MQPRWIIFLIYPTVWSWRPWECHHFLKGLFPISVYAKSTSPCSIDVEEVQSKLPLSSYMMMHWTLPKPMSFSCASDGKGSMKSNGCIQWRWNEIHVAVQCEYRLQSWGITGWDLKKIYFILPCDFSLLSQIPLFPQE